ncbi:serine/threonine-protein kinase haspin homolog isoform X2 [Drosophila grimshawi]|uniref:serine/threonine-protein kinase haspin homolog isoform X2 n=1 Tax=Drosophila grimshawi TaxID=7222 RepID=UPI000C870481|nr:serine/threonine-protein kinase haspin homolog isoform X2 [Drosophila grimshawi]
MDNTLPDDAWKDSFDKLLDQRPQLRDLNVIKRDVRASFNIDSSVENTDPNMLSAIECSMPNPNLLAVPQDLNPTKKKRSDVISTPCTKLLHSNLFHCALSPITGMKIDGLKPIDDNHKLDDIEKEQPRRPKHVCFEVNSFSLENTNDTDIALDGFRILPKEVRSSLVLQPGKWRKPLITWRRTHNNDAPRSLSPKKQLTTRAGTAEGLILNHVTQRKSVHIKNSLEPKLPLSHEQEVLKYCAQSRPYKFSSAYGLSKMIDTCKIGEGVYVLPIEGAALVNGEAQKTFEQILPEIIISKEMSNLRLNPTNSTTGFVDIYNACLVKGKYPKHLIKLWEDYDDEKESENDHPDMFNDNQLFIVLELKFAGEDMSSFLFLNAEQSYYALQQIILTLAVGEEAFQFEHRDLHWGNILIEKTDERKIAYKLCGRDLLVATKGIRTTIIDYTLSRITVDDCCHYNDLSTDEELFAATGDYQYDIYRLMRDELQNNWSAYSPRTNVLWLSYVCSKLIDGVKYKSTNSKAHKMHMEKLKAFDKIVLTLNSAVNCADYLH